ncbi:MAG: methyltransferase domain-containing protein [Nitrospirae bacterium]|nr:MAG: methyltransferase domain-containing protein [Nitrospirota bacterium]
MDRQGMNKRAILSDLLVCPLCRGILKEGQEEYECLDCHKTYPVTNDIPRFLPDLSDKEQQVKRSFNLEHLRYTDSRHLHFTPRLVQQWLDEIQLPPEYFKGKLVLDAGCGSGRWTYAMASLGATVVAVDLTEAGAEITHQATAHMDNVAVLQASLFQLPFNPESFDLVVSWGVLHHTPDTKKAFARIAPLVKPGGQLYVMVYEKQNIVKAFCTGLIRLLLQRFPEEQRYRLCRRLIFKNRRLSWVLKHLFICAYYSPGADALEVSTIQLGLYDAYSPRYNHLHSSQEVFAWFGEQRFDQLMLTSPIRYTDWLKVWLAGECGGSIKVRGRRV